MSRKPSTPKAHIPAPENKTKRDRSWERDQRANYKPITFRKVPDYVTDQANQVATDLYVVRDEVFRVFWDYAYGAYQRGEIELHPVLEKGKLTLFPEERD